MKRIASILSVLAIISFCIVSCVPKTEKPAPPYVDPALEKDTIQNFIARKGFNMKEVKGADGQGTGIMFEVLDSSSEKLSKEKPVAHVAYSLRLLNDTLVEHANRDTFNLNEVVLIKPFAYFLQMMGKGGHIRFITPSAYAYGNASSKKIPANSPLYFDVKLLDIKAE